MTPSATGSRAYEIMRELSRDETGESFKAVSPDTRSTVAVRVIRPGPHTAPSAEGVLENTSKALQLNSPNIVLLREAYEEDGLVYLVMDYAEGVTLASAISQGKLADWDLLDTARQVCAAIDHAHSRGVSHQNLNPANIVQEWDGTVKVLDYGVSLDVVRQVVARPERVSVAHYLSPEQTRGIPPNRRSNLFSLGVILYEMLTGQKPFAAEPPDGLFEQIRTSEPRAPHLVCGKASQAVSKVLLRLLAKLPEERYESGADFVRELEGAMRSKGPAIVPAVATARSSVAAAQPQVPSPTVRTDPASSTVVNGTSSAPVAAVESTRPEVPAGVVKPVQNFSRAESPKAAPVEKPTTKLQPTPRSEFLIVGARPDAPVNIPPAKVAESPKTVPVMVSNNVAPAAQVTPEARAKQSSPRRSGTRTYIYVAAAALLIVAVVGVAWMAGAFRSSRKVAQETIPSVVSAPPSKTVEDLTQADKEAEAVEATQSRPVQASKKARQKSAPAAPIAPVFANLIVDSTPQGAAIQIDGQATPFVTPHTLAQLAPGAHTIGVSRTGFDAGSKTVELGAGQNASVTFTLVESRGIVAITSDPPGAEVAIDGNATGRVTPVTVALLKGSHAFAFRKAGFVSASTSVVVSPGGNYRVSPRLTALGDAAQIKEVGKLKKLFGAGGVGAKLQFRSSPKGAQISINQRVMNKVTPAEFAFPPGTYEVILSLPGYKPFHRTLQVVDETSERVEATLERTAP